MNTRKNYNSIVFLTVYLGLVLVGATPQVLAQAATPRLFDIKTEIEFKDNLDKNPDNEEKATSVNPADSFFEEAAFLSESINRHKFENNFSTSPALIVRYDELKLKLDVSAFNFSLPRADYFAENLNRLFDLNKTDKEKPLVKAIHKNTSFKSENNQVFIVTRLPRAAIDEFLAVKNAR